jgi:hypothetical protein
VASSSRWLRANLRQLQRDSILGDCAKEPLAGVGAAFGARSSCRQPWADFFCNHGLSSGLSAISSPVKNTRAVTGVRLSFKNSFRCGCFTVADVVQCAEHPALCSRPWSCERVRSVSEKLSLLQSSVLFAFCHAGSVGGNLFGELSHVVRKTIIFCTMFVKTSCFLIDVTATHFSQSFSNFVT